MEQFETEEQQVEAIKRFWKENGTAIIVGAVLGLGGLFGWRYYSDSQIAAKEQASAGYQAALETLTEEANDYSQLTAFISENKGSGYADIAALIAAQQASANGDLDAAAAQLADLASNTEDAQIAVIAGLRLARIQIALEQLDAALQTVEGLNNDAFNAQISEVKGDVLVAQNKTDQARVAYTAALEAAPGNRLVQMKLDNLAVVAGA